MDLKTSRKSGTSTDDSKWAVFKIGLIDNGLINQIPNKFTNAQLASSVREYLWF